MDVMTPCCVPMKTFVHVAKWATDCDPDCICVAGSPELNLVVTSHRDDGLSVWQGPDSVDDGFVLVRKIGFRHPLQPPVDVCFGSTSGGHMVFVPHAPSRVFLTDRYDAVHVVDVVDGTHAGYLARPGSLSRPRHIAACALTCVVAVTSYCPLNGLVDIHLFSKGSCDWGPLRIIRARCPVAMAFSADGSSLVVGVADGQLVPYSVCDGREQAAITTAIDSCNGFKYVDGHWVFLNCWPSFHSDTIQYVDDCGVGRNFLESDDLFFRKAIIGDSVAWVPGIGIVVVHSAWNPGSKMQVYSLAMSVPRLTWMTAVARGVFRAQTMRAKSAKRARPYRGGLL